MIVIDKEKVKRILVIKLRGIGDVILSTIVLDNLLVDFPDAKIDFLTDQPSKCWLENLDQINDVVVFDRKNIFRRFLLFFTVRKNKYDLILDLFANPATAQLTFFSGASYRIGLPYKGRKYAYNILGPAERAKYHSAQLHLEILKMANLNHFKNNLYFGLSTEAKSFAKKYMTDNFSSDKLIIGISTSGGWSSKKCPPEKFAEIADLLIEKYNASILILWGHGDLEDAELTKINMKHTAILAPETDILKMGALISECDLLISNDSGPMHISTALGTPVLSIHGPTNPKLQGPFGENHEWINLPGLDCIICNLLQCPRNKECFYDLPNKIILEKIIILIEKNKLIHPDS